MVEKGLGNAGIFWRNRMFQCDMSWGTLPLRAGGHIQGSVIDKGNFCSVARGCFSGSLRRRPSL